MNASLQKTPYVNTTVIRTSEKGLRRVNKNPRSAKRKTNAKFNPGIHR